MKRQLYFATIFTTLLFSGFSAHADTFAKQTELTGPVIYNVYSGLNLTDAQTAQLVFAIQETGLKFEALNAGTIRTGAEFGLSMAMRNPSPESDKIVPAINEVMDAYAKANVKTEDQVRLLNAKFGKFAEFSFSSTIFYSEAELAKGMALENEWLGKLDTFLTPGQMATLISNRKVTKALTGIQSPMGLQFFMGSEGQPLVAPN